MNEAIEDAQWVMEFLKAIEITGRHAPTATMQRVIDRLFRLTYENALLRSQKVPLGSNDRDRLLIGSEMTEHLWPYPTLAEKLDELTKLDDAIRKRLKAMEREVAAIANLQAELSCNAADCVRLSIMQWDNA